MRPARILIIEKDEALAVELVSALEKAGYEVVRTIDIIGGIKKLYESPPDLVIVAQEANVTTNEDRCLRIRQATYVPLLILGNDEDEASEMLELGADAYMTKPPGLIELVARVRSLLRRKPRYDPLGGDVTIPYEIQLAPVDSPGEISGEGCMNDKPLGEGR